MSLEENAIEVYREPHLAGYGAKSVLRGQENACPHAFPDTGIAVAEVVARC